MTRVPLNVLDLVPVVEGGSASSAIEDTTALAQQVESLGYQRYWMAEHHNMTGVASSSTAVLIAHVAARTRTIRVGAGGIMLPNHAPLVVAEQFGTLAAIHGDRIDLGLGRAPGTDPLTAYALRRDELAATDFGAEVAQVQRFLGPADETARVRAVPGEGTNVPIWILGSSHGGAQVAAMMGLPYSFASHFAPAMLLSALDLYRTTFRPSVGANGRDKPYTMAAANVMVADTEDEARLLWSSTLQRFHGIVTGRRGLLPEPVPDPERGWTHAERAAIEQMTAVSFVGTPVTVRDGLEAFVRHTGVDEVIVSCAPHDAAARRRSLQLLAEAWHG